MKKKTERRSRIVGSAMLPVHIICEKHRLDFFGFIMAIEEIAEAAGKERNELPNFLSRHPAKTVPDAQKFPPTLRTAKRRIGRRLEKERLQIAREFFQLIVHAHKGFSVAWRNLPKLGDSVL